MRKSRLISLPLAATLAVAVAGPATASHLPGPPTWPTNPQPITSYAYQLPGPPTWPTNPQPIPAYHSTVQATYTGFDLDSAAIGAAGSTAILAAAIAGVAGVRRRRRARPQSLATH
jgi:hypothetical protein